MEVEKTIIKELKKINIDYNELKDNEKALLIEAENALKTICEKNNNVLKDYLYNDYSVNLVCDELNKTKQLLYRTYPSTVKYINSRISYYQEKEKKFRKKLVEGTDEDKQTIQDLMKRDVEYMEMKQIIIEQEKTIKELRQQVATLARRANASNKATQTTSKSEILNENESNKDTQESKQVYTFGTKNKSNFS